MSSPNCIQIKSPRKRKSDDELHLKNLKADALQNDSPPLLEHVDDQGVSQHFAKNDPLIVRKPKGQCKKLKKEAGNNSRKEKEQPKVASIIKKEEKELIPRNSITARRYQLEILEKALQENTIVFLETGCGKTLIAVLLIRQIVYQVRSQKEKRIAIFLAPTVHLVMQQSEVLKINTDLKVDNYHGAKGVDYWSQEMWQAEIEKNEVLVMTPQVLLDALRHSFIRLDIVELLVVDECHHTQKSHAYAKIMREYYHSLNSKSTKVFGMTASPVIRKGVSSSIDCAQQMQRLEFMLDSKVYTLKDRIELESFVPTPNQKTEYYERSEQANESVTMKLNALKEKYEGLQRTGCEVADEKSQFKDDEEYAKKLRKKIRKLHNSLEYSLQELGLWCALKAAEVLLKKDRSNAGFDTDIDLLDELRSVKDTFLKEAIQVFESVLPKDPSIVAKDVAVAVKKGWLTSKVQHLVKCLMEYRDVVDMRCIVFVERVVGAMVLATIANQFSCLSFLKCEYLSGSTSSNDAMARKQQQRTIESFRTGKVNVLVATDVAEEGLDVQNCSSVIRFDLSKSVRSFIQSRGRARRPGSDYVILLERNNQKQEDLLLDVIRSEESMRAQALSRTYHSACLNLEPMDQVEFYRVESTGATINTDSSISFIHRFCSKLPGDKYYFPKPEFSFMEDGEEGLHVCKLTLPPNGPFPELVGPPRTNPLLAKQVACLEACKKLHALGQVNDHLLPVSEVAKPEEDIANMNGKKASGAGTNKRKELHPTTETTALRCSWVIDSQGVDLQAYILSFTVLPKEDKAYSNFVFLTSSIIDEDVASMEMTLYLTEDRVAMAKLTAAGKLHLNSNQLEEAKVFQEVLLNGMFSKVMKRCKSTDVGVAMPKVKVLLPSNRTVNKLWCSSQMYLLLPLFPFSGSSNMADISIDWSAVNESAVAARLLMSLSSSQDEVVKKRNETELPIIVHNDKEGERMIQLASGSLPESAVLDKAIITVHTGRIYCVTTVLWGENADSPFEKSLGSNASKYGSYSDYFKSKYGMQLKFPEQPLLQVKQTHRLHNLLTRHSNNSKGKECVQKVKADAFVEIPPELCLVLGVSSSVVRSLYFVPSVMSRLNSLLLASQLRQRIKQDLPLCGSIPALRVMEALTTLRCLEGFSFEGLELLGDSFLKYAVSRYLFLMYDKEHEGQLSARRCRAICNATLHRCAAARDLPGYIRDEPFDPGRWVAPGMLCPRELRCRCNLSNLSHPDNIGEDDKGSSRKVFKIGMTCDKGHRWMCSKTISDAVEALIGAYYVESGTDAAVGFMTWMGIEVGYSPSLIEYAVQRASVHPNILHSVNVVGLETELGYVFRNKSLLVEAITHASQQDPQGGCCYQRLEFLGDAVLDLLITRHLFSTHPGLSPGYLTDLRSAAVNNECFARAAVKHNLQRYLRHGSGALLGQITDFVKVMQEAGQNENQQSFGWEGIRGPKVLGDMVESIAGAILLDSRFNLDQVWAVMKPLLSPIVTPETLPLQPIRELHELCHLQSCSFSWKKSEKDGGMTLATAEILLNDELITGTARRSHKKAARKDAVQQILSVLESRGICHPRRQIMPQVAKELSSLEQIVIATSKSMEEGAEKRKIEDDELSNSSGGDDKRLRLESGDYSGIAEEQVTLSHTKTKGFLVVQTAENAQDSASRIICQDEEEDHTGKAHILETESCRKRGNLIDKKEKALQVKFAEENNTEKDGSLRIAESDEHVPQITTVDERRDEREEEKEVSSSQDSSVLVESVQLNVDEIYREDVILLSKIKREDIAGIAIESSNNMDLKGGIAGSDTLFEGALSFIQKIQKGSGRSTLYELCSKQKWCEPHFEMAKQEGPPHTRWFTFSVTICVPDKGPVKIFGQPMRCKKRAMDDAAMKMLITLKKSGIEIT